MSDSTGHGVQERAANLGRAAGVSVCTSGTAVVVASSSDTHSPPWSLNRGWAPSRSGQSKAVHGPASCTQQPCTCEWATRAMPSAFARASASSFISTPVRPDRSVSIVAITPVSP